MCSGGRVFLEMDALVMATFGSSSPPHHLIISELLPSTEQYLTYDGSLTVPGCYETVTWILPNKPIYISFAQMRNLRRLKQGTSDFRRNAPLPTTSGAPICPPTAPSGPTLSSRAGWVGNATPPSLDFIIKQTSGFIPDLKRPIRSRGA
ncbi:putative carbonic anhydrase [Penaeus vannamei]|uniref:Putative carbonic anhydrase n=1 Tax=Penaeus vannamei TaxID=6689 RepID=A0A423T6Z3_PENVA|nr:putative carbonic anhydrase [Penaeus vannamei]